MTISGKNAANKLLKPKNSIRSKLKGGLEDDKPVNKLVDKAKSRNPLARMKKK